MPLRHRIKTNPETLQDLELASEQAYWAGIELLVSGYSASGIYLLGFVAEMLLKRACFLIDGARISDGIFAMLRSTRTWGRQHIPTIPFENFHNLDFWLNVLIIKRRNQNRPLPLQLEVALSLHVKNLYENWIVDMRYKPEWPLSEEEQSVYDAITWIRAHRYEFDQ